MLTATVKHTHTRTHPHPTSSLTQMKKKIFWAYFTFFSSIILFLFFSFFWESEQIPPFVNGLFWSKLKFMKKNMKFNNYSNIKEEWKRKRECENESERERDKEQTRTEALRCAVFDEEILCRAARNGNVKKVRSLLQQGVCANVRYQVGCGRSEWDVCEVFFRIFTEVWVQNDVRSLGFAFPFACVWKMRGSHFHCVLFSGVFSVLFWCILSSVFLSYLSCRRSFFFEIAESLTKKCGKGEKRFHISFPQTPLHFAAQHEDDECLNLLLQHGVDVSAKDVRIEKCGCLFFVCADSIHWIWTLDAYSW